MNKVKSACHRRGKCVRSDNEVGCCCQAESLVLSMRDLFQVAFETKKKQEAEVTTGETGAKSEPTSEEQSTEVSASAHRPANERGQGSVFEFDSVRGDAF